MSLRFPDWAAIALIAVQGADAAMHLVTGQVEPVRLVSNGILTAWVLVWFPGLKSRVIAACAIAAYLALNAWFLAQNGLSNPEMDGALRLPLFALVGLSVALWFITVALTPKRTAKTRPQAFAPENPARETMEEE